MMKRAIIIGASSGMGREVSELLLADGWRIGVAARREDKLLEIKAMNPAMVEVMPIDVTCDDAPERLLSLAGRLGGVDLYFHASGSGKQNPQLDGNVELNTLQLNALGFTRMMDAMFNYMAQNGGGHIAAISSIAGTKGLGVAPSYSATKAYQATYIQALEQLANMRGLNISFTDIRPGFVDTALLSDGEKYPLMMNPKTVARKIVKAIRHRKRIKIIDWRYSIMVFFWRLIPNPLWSHLNIRTSSK